MKISSISLVELKTVFGIQAEFTRDLMLDKIFLLVVSHFCVATELRFLSGLENSLIKGKEARIWHKKSIEYAKSYLPSSCPLYSHIKSSFKRNYTEDLSNTIKRKRSQRRMDNSFRSKRALTPGDKTQSQSRLRSSSAKGNLMLKEENKSKNRHKTPQPKIASKQIESFSSVENGVNLIEVIPSLQTVQSNILNTRSNILDFDSNSNKHEKKFKLEIKSEIPTHKPNDMSHPVPYDELDAKLKKIQEAFQEKETKSSSEDYDREEIIITSYDLYGIQSDEDIYESEEDSTGGRYEKESISVKAHKL